MADIVLGVETALAALVSVRVHMASYLMLRAERIVASLLEVLRILMTPSVHVFSRRFRGPELGTTYVDRASEIR